MIIDDCKRDELNRVIAICDGKEYLLSEEYIVAHKPQVGDELIIETPVEEPAETPAKK